MLGIGRKIKEVARRAKVAGKPKIFCVGCNKTGTTSLKVAMDEAYPGSRFILTVRDSSEQWYSSIVRFHSKLWGNGNCPPTMEELQNADYIYKGHPWHANRLIFNTPEEDPYHRDTLIEYYEGHNQAVEEYFSYRKDDLLVINTAKTNVFAISLA